MVRFPEHGVTAIVLANEEELDASALAFRVADHVLAERSTGLRARERTRSGA